MDEEDSATPVLAYKARTPDDIGWLLSVIVYEGHAHLNIVQSLNFVDFEHAEGFTHFFMTQVLPLQWRDATNDLPINTIPIRMDDDDDD